MSSFPPVDSLDIEEKLDCCIVSVPDLRVITSDGHRLVIKSNLVKHLEVLAAAHARDARDASNSGEDLPIQVRLCDLSVILDITSVYDQTLQREEQQSQSSINQIRSRITSLEERRKPLVAERNALLKEWTDLTSRIRALGVESNVEQVTLLEKELTLNNLRDDILKEKLDTSSSQVGALLDELSAAMEAQPLAHNVYLPGVSTQSTTRTEVQKSRDYALLYLSYIYPLRFRSTMDDNKMQWREDVFQLRQLAAAETYLGFPWLRNVLREKLVLQLHETFNNWLDAESFNRPTNWMSPSCIRLMRPVDLSPIVRFCGITNASSFVSSRDVDVVQSLEFIPPSSSDDDKPPSEETVAKARGDVLAMLQCSTGMEKHMLAALVNDSRFPAMEMSTLFECALLQGLSVTGPRFADTCWMNEEPYLSWTLSVISRKQASGDVASPVVLFERLLPAYQQILWGGRRREQLATAFGVKDPREMSAFKEAQSLKRFITWRNAAKKGESLSEFESALAQAASAKPSVAAVASPDLRSEKEIVAALKALRLKQLEAEAAKKFEAKKLLLQQQQDKKKVLQASALTKRKVK